MEWVEWVAWGSDAILRAIMMKMKKNNECGLKTC